MRVAAFDSAVYGMPADGDALLFGGVAWYLAGEYGGNAPLLPMAVLAGAMLISYERAKAEALGFDARGGLMERAERLVLLGFALLFDSLLVPVLWLMLVLTLVTAGQRFLKVWRQASTTVPTKATTERLRARRQARVSRTAARRQGRTTARERFAVRERSFPARRRDSDS